MPLSEFSTRSKNRRQNQKQRDQNNLLQCYAGSVKFALLLELSSILHTKFVIAQSTDLSSAASNRRPVTDFLRKKYRHPQPIFTRTRVPPYTLIMKMLAAAIIAIGTCFAAEQAISDKVRLNAIKVSELPIHGIETTESNANIIAIIGGPGLRNNDGKSRNYLVKQARTFVQAGINFYLLPNKSKQENAGYGLRFSTARTERILALVEIIRARNKNPIYLIGFSRGSVDAGRFAKTHPKSIDGIVLASGIYTNDSKRAAGYSMELIIGKHIETPTLIVHHENDKCRVTPFLYAEGFFKTLNAPSKKLLSYHGGDKTGRVCGPLHHHGFEGIETNVAQDISRWVLRHSD